MDKINLLINLPTGFFAHPVFATPLARMERFAHIRKTSHNTPEEIVDDLAWADAVLMWSWPVLTNELLAQSPRLRFSAQLDISRSGAEVALARNFPISVARRAFSPAVAEMALTLTLALLRKTSQYHAAMHTGTESWVNSFPDDIDPEERELTGRPVGIIGFGAVGQRFGELLAPFHCPLRIYDPFLPEAIVEKFGAEKTDLPTLLRESDVVTLCAASNAGTAKLLGAAEIGLLRPQAVLVNVARAALVDTDALITRLQQGDLFAAIDVFDQEPLPADHPLRTLPNAFLTPHRAGGTIASVDRILNMLIDDLEAFLADRPRTYALQASWLPALDG